MLDTDFSKKAWTFIGWIAALVLVQAGCSSKAYSTGGSLTIIPTQLYTGFDGTNTFRVGALASGSAPVTWTLDDPSLADLQFSGQQVTLTTKRAGSGMLVANDGSNRAAVPVTVAQYTPQQHLDGRERYTRGERFNRGDMGGGGPVNIPDGGFDRGNAFEERKPCTDCHGVARIEHGPNQCGWMSDDELKNVILAGVRPDGSPVYDQDDSVSHHWRASDVGALVAYIRALAVRGTPSQQ